MKIRHSTASGLLERSSLPASRGGTPYGVRRLGIALSCYLLVVSVAYGQASVRAGSEAGIPAVEAAAVHSLLADLEHEVADELTHAKQRIDAGAEPDQTELDPAALEQRWQVLHSMLERNDSQEPSWDSDANRDTLWRIWGWIYNLWHYQRTGLHPPQPQHWIDQSARGAGGVIAGRVVNAANLIPLDSAKVFVFDESGFAVTTTFPGAQGYYSQGGLAAGAYYVGAWQERYLGQVYDGQFCAFGGYESYCDPTTGMPIVLADGGVAQGVDFALRLGGRVLGSISNSDGQPLQSASIAVLDSSGVILARGFPASNGSYEVYGLPAGEHYVRATERDYQDELYDDIPCALGCDPTTGQAVPVAEGLVTGGVDFELSPGGAIAGRLTDAVTGEGVAFEEVSIRASHGTSFAYAISDADGYYQAGGLDAGVYFVYTRVDRRSPYRDVIYKDLLCLPGCAITAGTPVEVVGTSVTSGIDMALPHITRISGTLRDQDTGLPLGYVGTVYAYTSTMVPVATSAASFDGSYDLRGLVPGTYYLLAVDLQGYATQLYNGLPCTFVLAPGCSLSQGTAVTVGSGQQRTGVDFYLDRLGALGGRVLDAQTGEPVAARLTLWEDGSTSTLRVANLLGSYLFDDLEPGTYFLGAQRSLEYLAQLYQGIDCGPDLFTGCDPFSGTPIQVELNSETLLPDITLVPVHILVDGFETGDLSRWLTPVGPTR